MKGVIFDFNGTMVFDGHLHEKAWIDMVKKHNQQVSETAIIAYIHGRTNDQIIGHFIGEVTADKLQELSNEKELEYQQLVREEQLDFVKGTKELLEELVKRDIPFTIATASPEINIGFYFDYFELGRWFDQDNIIYDDGTFPGKPDPTIYQMAAESLELTPKECIVIEDAVAGVQSANHAEIGKVIVMVSSDEQRTAYEKSDLGIDGMIDHFQHFVGDYIC